MLAKQCPLGFCTNGFMQTKLLSNKIFDPGFCSIKSNWINIEKAPGTNLLRQQAPLICVYWPLHNCRTIVSEISWCQINHYNIIFTVLAACPPSVGTWPLDVPGVPGGPGGPGGPRGPGKPIPGAPVGPGGPVIDAPMKIKRWYEWSVE